jgi:LysR family transcriptional regulator, regulator for metE and metH
MIERTHLLILSQIHRRGSLTAAARALGLTQSALSHAIKRLEQEFETSIWQREGRGVRLTPAGQELLTLAQRVLPQFEHAEQMLTQFARGERGLLRIGMECHPCYQWLLKIVEPYLERFPDVDLDVKQKFQFGGIGALFGHEIDMLITPDPLKRRELHYEAVFPYEQVLVVSNNHPFASRAYVTPSDLAQETLITYPVELERLDIFSQFLLPAGLSPKRHQVIETTDIMLQMVACGRGVAALPGWLVADYKRQFRIKKVRLGRSGIPKQIHVGVRRADTHIGYITAFIDLARKFAGLKSPRRSSNAAGSRDA